MNKKIKFLAIVMAVTMLTAFTDVPKSHWGFSGISQAQSLGIVNGVSKDLFEPDSNISKQEIAVMVYRMHDLVTSSDMGDLEQVEVDMEKLKPAGIAEWASQQVSYGLENHYWTLDDFSGESLADTDASRELVAKWLVNVSGFKDFALRVLPYSDVEKISPSCYGYVNTLYRYGIMRGSEGSFYPQEGIQRAEAAVSAVRIFNEKQAQYSKIYEQPVVFYQGKLEKADKSARSFSIGGTFFNIASQADILVDGKVTDFASVASLASKNVSVSCVLDENNPGQLIIQSRPVSISGNLKEITTYNESVHAEKPFSVATIEIEGHNFDFIIDSNSEILSGGLSAGPVQFISDGIYILEIR